MNPQIKRLENGPWKENSFVVHDENGIAVVIDPGEDFEQIKDYVVSAGLKVTAILNTHGHFDHVAGVQELKDAFQAPFYLHSGDLKLLKAANFYRRIFESKSNIRIPNVDFDLKEMTEVSAGALRFQVIPAPGHTEGGVFLKVQNKLFSGDNILGSRIGRTDLPGGNRPLLEETVRRLFELPPETEIYPGHGPMTTLGNILSTYQSIAELITKPALTKSTP